MASEKTVNYTAEQEAELVARYQAGETTAELAEAFGKGVRSVIAKLSRLGVYKAKEKATSGRVTKAQLVTQIAGVLEVDPLVLSTFEKADRQALEALALALTDRD